VFPDLSRLACVRETAFSLLEILLVKDTPLQSIACRSIKRATQVGLTGAGGDAFGPARFLRVRNRGE